MQEVFRQKCLDSFHVSKFFPLFYVAFNVSVIISSVYFWSDLHDADSMNTFLTGFSAAISLMSGGITLVHRGELIKTVRPLHDLAQNVLLEKRLPVPQ